MQFSLFSLPLPVLLAGTALAQTAAPDGTIRVQTDKPGAAINPGFYGLMTEEINHAYDGGLYAELIQNRVFKDNDRDPIHWLLVQDGGGAGAMSIDKADPVNPALTNSLKLEVTAAGKRVGVANEGFCNYSKRPGGRVGNSPGGLPVRPDTAYKVTFYAKAQGLLGAVDVSLESNDHKTVYARGTVSGLTGQWRKFELALKTGADVTPSLNNHFVISARQPGTLWLSCVSLFPPTYKNRPNGNRIDLSEKLAALRPAFLRFPGGNYLDPGHYRWKNTIGPVDQRPGNPGAWGYRTSEGLGLLEFFLWCEDLNMEPILAVSVGRPWLPAKGDVEPLVQDALDEIEYAIGDASTEWGAKRAADGHPAPFKLRYVEIGNEDFFDPRATYESRFPKFHDAIKAKYPQLKFIATRRDMHTAAPDLIDDHLYADASAMARAGAAYDHYSRQAPKIFVGEWATQDGQPTPTLRGALGDAAYLTGLERNADVIEMACYAPLFTSILPNGAQWPTNLIGYDALNSFGSPSYHMQVMFNHNRGDAVLPTEVTVATEDEDAQAPLSQGRVGVGTYNTQAEFKDVTLARTGAAGLLYFGSGEGSWKTGAGDWKPQDGVFAQTGNQQFTLAALGEAGWTDYTYSLKARKTGGKEGFLVYFHVKDSNNLLWWNLGGWDNTRSALEKRENGQKAEFGESADVTIETNRWYDIKIEVNGRRIRCYLDGKLVTEASEEKIGPALPVYACASSSNRDGDVILKVVNMSGQARTMQIDLSGAKQIAPMASGQVLTGKLDDMNSVQEPEKIVPQDVTITDAGAKFSHEFPASSVTVLRLKTR